MVQKKCQSIGKSGETKIVSDMYLSRAPLSQLCDRKEKRRDGKRSTNNQTINHQPNQHKQSSGSTATHIILPITSIIIFFSSCSSHCPPSMQPSRNFLRKNSNVPSAWKPAPTRSSTRNAITASVVNA